MAWYWLSKQKALLFQRVCSRLLFTWLSKAKESMQSCTIRPIEFLKLLRLRFLLFYRFINVSVTLEVTPTAFNIQPCNFWVCRSLYLALDWSILLQISVLNFFTFNESKFSGLGWLSNFLTSFSLFIGVQITLLSWPKCNLWVPQFVPPNWSYFQYLWWVILITIFILFINATPLCIANVGIINKSWGVSMWGVSIWSSKSDPSYRDNSSSSHSSDPPPFLKVILSCLKMNLEISHKLR